MFGMKQPNLKRRIYGDSGLPEGVRRYSEGEVWFRAKKQKCLPTDNYVFLDCFLAGLLFDNSTFYSPSFFSQSIHNIANFAVIIFKIR